MKSSERRFRSITAGLAGIFLILSASAARAEPDQKAAAQRHFARGVELTKGADHRAAIGEYLQAYELLPLPNIAFNIGREYQALAGSSDARTDDAQLAVRWYLRYLKSRPDARDAGEVRAEIGKLTDAPDAVVAPPSRPVAAPLLVGGLALVTAGVGTAFYLDVQLKVDQLNRTCRYPCSASFTAGLPSIADAAYALWAVGGAVAAVDIALWIYRAAHDPTPPSGATTLRLTPALTPNFAGLSLAGRF